MVDEIKVQYHFKLSEIEAEKVERAKKLAERKM